MPSLPEEGTEYISMRGELCLMEMQDTSQDDVLGSVEQRWVRRSDAIDESDFAI